MVSLKVLELGLLLVCVRAEVFEFFARDVDNGQRVQLGSVTLEDNNVTDVQLDKFQGLEGVYCFGAQSSNFHDDCFSYLRVNPKKNKYSLALDVHGDKLEGFSLFRDDEGSEDRHISAKVRTPVVAPQPPAIKLRKKTMTYAEKKAESKLEAVQKQGKEVDIDDDEEDQRTFFERNWKKMLIGFLVYNVVAAFAKQQQEQQQQQ